MVVQFSSGAHALEMQAWPDRHTWQAYLATATPGHCVVLGTDAEAIRAFYTVTLHRDSLMQAKTIIAVCSEGHGLSPALWLHPDGAHILVGFNSQVTCIDLLQIESRAVHELESLFYRFLWVPEAQRLIVQHEIGVVAFSTAITEVWRYSEDIITAMSTDGDVIQLAFMDAPPVRLSAHDGLVIAERQQNQEYDSELLYPR